MNQADVGRAGIEDKGNVSVQLIETTSTKMVWAYSVDKQRGKQERAVDGRGGSQTFQRNSRKEITLLIWIRAELNNRRF